MVFLVILTAAVLETTTAFSVGVTSISRESFAVDDFTCSDAIRLLPPYVELPVILQLFHEHYLEMETNFLLVMKQHAPQRIGSLYLVCLDDASAATIDALFGLACVTIDGVTSFRSLMLIRVKIIVCLLRGGRDVLVSDNDALWLADPIPDLHAIEGDVLFQRGVFPRMYGDPIYGVTLCTGFALYRAGGEGMETFLTLMEKESNKHGDGQKGLNEAVYQLHLKWDYNATNSDMRNVESTGVGRGVLTALPGNFVVALLPHNRYPRTCIESMASSDAIIVHCFPRRNRKAAMKKLKLWLVE